MKNRPSEKNISALRKRAEEIMNARPEDLSDLKAADVQTLLHELHVHEIELEMQNEELLDTQRRLEDARNRYNDLFDNAPVGYLVMDRYGRVSEANLKAASMLEFERYELVGKMFTEFVDRESQDRFYMHRREAAKSGQPQAAEIGLVKKGGEVFPVILESITVAQPGGEGIQMRTAIRDITVRRGAEENVADLSEKLQRIAEESPVVVYIYQDGRFAYANRKLAEMTGYSLDEALGLDDVLELVHPEDREMLGGYLKGLLSGEISSAQIEFRGIRKGGGMRHVEFFGYSTTFKGRPAVAGIGVDITRRKAAEAARESALQKAEEGRRILEALMENIPIGITIVDAPEARVRMVSKYGLRLLGAEDEDMSGMSAIDYLNRLNVYHPEGLRPVRQEELATVRTVREGVTITDEERLVRRPDHSEVPVLLNAGPIKDKDGKVTGGIVVWRDITIPRQIDRDRTNFYAMVSHDIRSPLSSIIGNAEFILTYRKNKLDEDTVKMLSSMLKDCEKIRRLVDDFLVHSRLEAGGAVLSFKRVDPAQILMDVYEEMSILAKKKYVDLAAEAAEGLPKAFIDRKHVVIALKNLVQNALDCMPKGGRVRMKAEQAVLDGEEALVYTVSDNGPGVPQSEQALIFDKYYRSPCVRGVKSTGLGLAIARAVAEAHAGRVELESEPGKGSTFRLVLPVLGEK